MGNKHNKININQSTNNKSTCIIQTNEFELNKMLMKSFESIDNNLTKNKQKTNHNKNAHFKGTLQWLATRAEWKFGVGSIRLIFAARKCF